MICVLFDAKNDREGGELWKSQIWAKFVKNGQKFGGFSRFVRVLRGDCGFLSRACGCDRFFRGIRGTAGTSYAGNPGKIALRATFSVSSGIYVSSFLGNSQYLEKISLPAPRKKTDYKL